MAGKPPKPSVAIIGAGIAGLACARMLADRGCQAVVFDRGRRPGGRLTARRIAVEEGKSLHADHGAPFFACTDERFATHLRLWIGAGVCFEWNVECVVWSDGTHRMLCAEPPDHSSGRCVGRISGRISLTVCSTPDCRDTFAE